jgi:hypothetical protein
VKRIHLPRQGDVAPGGADLAHVDRDLAGLLADGVEQARLGLDRAALPAGFRHDQGGDATRCVSAGLDLAAVGVADAHENVRRAVRRRLHGDQLVAADADAAVGHGAGGRRVDSARASTTTKSLPRPCIFVKGRGFMLRVIGRATRPV